MRYTDGYFELLPLIRSGADTGFLKGGSLRSSYAYIVCMPILGGLGACPPGNFTL